MWVFDKRRGRCIPVTPEGLKRLRAKQHHRDAKRAGEGVQMLSNIRTSSEPVKLTAEEEAWRIFSSDMKGESSSRAHNDDRRGFRIARAQRRREKHTVSAMVELFF